MLKRILAAFVMLYAALAMAAADVNKATEAELDGVKGIGPATSRIIMAERKKGAFKNWDDFISRVTGISEGRAARLSADGLTVNGSAFKAVSAKAAKPGDSKPAAGTTNSTAVSPTPAAATTPAVAAARAKGAEGAAARK